ncbi:MAG: hypothetical protein LV481_16070 [Methylacidiphilales bacterium]|nr:hypothetical protein [Candidatus Methylacidiphilales bacterium]
MNDIRGRLSAFSGATQPDFAHSPGRFKPSVILRTAKNGSQSQVLRPIQPEDKPALRRFHSLLSEVTIYKRYFEHFNLDGRIDHRSLSRICTNDSDSFALVIERHEGLDQPAEILAMGHLTTMDQPYVAAFTLLMRDEARDLEFDSIMLQRLIVLARASGFKLLVDDDLVQNHDLLNLYKKLGFTLHTIPKENIVRVCLSL